MQTLDHGFPGRTGPAGRPRARGQGTGAVGATQGTGLADGTGVGHLLKDRRARIGDFLDAIGSAVLLLGVPGEEPGEAAVRSGKQVRGGGVVGRRLEAAALRGRGGGVRGRTHEPRPGSPREPWASKRELNSS